VDRHPLWLVFEAEGQLQVSNIMHYAEQCYILRVREQAQ
jgi:hypothetical protein